VLQLFRKRQPSVIGFEFGACSLRAAQLVHKQDGWHLYHWINVEVDPASADAPPLDHAPHVANVLGPATFSGRRAAIALSPPDVEYRLLEVPSALLSMSPADLRGALQIELDRQMPWPASESEVALWPTRPTTGNTINTMVVAARSAGVHQLVAHFPQRRCECVRADIVPNALIRLCGAENAGSISSGRELWGILDIGFRSCRLYLIHDGRPVFARVLRGGGRELTETLARALHVDFSIAEQYKRLYGVQQSDRGVRTFVGGLGRISEQDLPGVLYAILARTFETLVADIERSYRFVLDRHDVSSAAGLCLVGGGSRLKGLDGILAQQLGIPVRHPQAANVLRNARGPDGSEHPGCSRANFPVLATCIGLALGEEPA
jgi:type IV pilus assembly protein PilM